MGLALQLSLPKILAEELIKRASAAGVTLDEYLFDLVLRDLDPRSSAEKYIEGAQQLIEQAERELGAGDLRQASEKIWGACALAIKAHAAYRAGKRLMSHADLWVYKDEVVRELGGWVRTVFMVADSMHRNFYENIATREDVESALKDVRNLVGRISEAIRRG